MVYRLYVFFFFHGSLQNHGANASPRHMHENAVFLRPTECSHAVVELAVPCAAAVERLREKYNVFKLTRPAKLAVALQKEWWTGEIGHAPVPSALDQKEGVPGMHAGPAVVRRDGSENRNSGWLALKKPRASQPPLSAVLSGLRENPCQSLLRGLGWP